MGTASIGSSVVIGSGAYSRVDATRDVSIETVGDDEAYLRLQYNDTIEFDCEAVETLLWVTNQLKAPIESFSFDAVGADEEIGVELLALPDSIDVGETAEVRARLSCLDGDGTRPVNFEIEVSGPDLSVHAHRTDEISIACHCPSETAWAIREGPDGTPDPTANRLNELEGIRANRWGWYLPYELGAGPVDGQLWSGAGQNDLDHGEQVGSVEFDDDGDAVTVSLQSNEGTMLRKSHCYAAVGTDRLAAVNAAPGRFQHDSASATYDPSTSTYTIPLDAIDGSAASAETIVLAVHADVVPTVE